MLIVLMAIIDFSRMKVYAVTRWLWLALSGGMFVAAPLGCEKDCNCRCECGQPPVTLTAPVDRPDAAVQATTDSGAAIADAKAGQVNTATDAAVNADTVNATTPAETTPPKKTPPKKRTAPKETERIVVPDVPQVAYGPPPVMDPGREIQPLYGVPMEKRPVDQGQLLYGPPMNLDRQDSD